MADYTTNVPYAGMSSPDTRAIPTTEAALLVDITTGLVEVGTSDGGGTPTTTHYHKRAWRAESSAYVEWDTTDPDGAYPGGGTLTPALGVTLFKWTT